MLLVFIATMISIVKDHSILGQDDYQYKYVNTSLGQVKAELQYIALGSTYPFLGIPYAAPPVGDLRFKKPQPAEPWTGTIGDKMPPACIQYSQHPYPWYDQEPGKSEDCLYLNVWVPSSVFDGLRPVLVFIHGGGFSYGSNRMDVYDGSGFGTKIFAKPGQNDDDVVDESGGFGGFVVATFNYRLGALGFLTSGTEDAPGNVGIYDMLMALHWIKDNIHYFGGDPNKLTLYGQGAGSIAISLMCVSPSFEGLFQRVILHSGTFVSLKENHFEENLKLGQRLAEAVDCSEGDKTLEDNPEEVVACLRGVDATQLATTLNSFNPTASFAFYPEYCNELFPCDPVQALKDGKVHDVDMVIGGSHTEGTYLLTSMYPNEFGVFGEKDKGGINKTFAETILRDAFKTYPEPEEIVDHFLKDFEGDDYQLRNQTYTALGDDKVFCPLVYFAEKYGDKTGKVHFFAFSLHPLDSPWADWMESVHFNDAPYLLARPLTAQPNGKEEERIQIVSFAIRFKYSLYLTSGQLDTVYKQDDGYSHGIPAWTTLHFSSSSQGYNFFNDSAGQKFGPPLANQNYPRYDPEQSNCDFLRKYHGF